jgi:multiple sugar transport system substrate-binding protein
MSAKKTYFILIIGISILLLTILCGCSESDKPSVSSDTQKTMNMYVKSSDTRTIAAISDFNYANKAQIHYETISYDQMQNGEYMKKLTTEIMAGEGPDIILDSTYSFPGLNKMAKSKVSCDLDQYINKDKQIKLSDFYEKVLDCGVVDNKRYYIPINYQIPILWSSKKMIGNNNIIIDESQWTFSDLHNIQTEYIKNQT